MNEWLWSKTCTHRVKLSVAVSAADQRGAACCSKPLTAPLCGGKRHSSNGPGISWWDINVAVRGTRKGISLLIPIWSSEVLQRNCSSFFTLFGKLWMKPLLYEVLNFVFVLVASFCIPCFFGFVCRIIQTCLNDRTKGKREKRKVPRV